MTRFYLAAFLALTSSCMGGGSGEGGGRGDDGSVPEDCDDPNRPAWLDWREVVRDADGDGFGSGPVEKMCLAIGAALPGGWIVAGGPTDCAPADPSLWSLRPFAGRDGDLDGTAVATAGEICSGGQLPAGYLDDAPASEPDCDDSDPDRWRLGLLFEDRDEDGFGAGPAAERCTGDRVPVGQSLIGGDCAPNLSVAWALLDYAYRDVDGDGFTIPETGQVCTGAALPPGYATSPGEASDCEDADPLRFRIWIAFADADGDEVGEGDAQTICAGSAVPDGYATVSGDCAVADASRWRLLRYSFRDADVDTYTVAQAGTICSGTRLPIGYRANSGAGADCNDGDPLLFLSLVGFADTDGDGRGAGDASTFCTPGTLPGGVVATGGDCAPDDAALHTLLVSFPDLDGDNVGAGEPVSLCTGGTRPPGFVADGGDCAPTDRAAWRMVAYRWVDRDEDGRTLAESGQVCTGASLPPPFRDSPSGNDCDDTDPALLGWAVHYEDGDGDGVGAGQRSLSCIGDSPPVGQSIHGDDADDRDPVIQTDEDDELELELILS